MQLFKTGLIHRQSDGRLLLLYTTALILRWSLSTKWWARGICVVVVALASSMESGSALERDQKACACFH